MGNKSPTVRQTTFRGKYMSERKDEVLSCDDGTAIFALLLLASIGVGNWTKETENDFDEAREGFLGQGSSSLLKSS